MIDPLSCKKNKSDMVNGARHSAAPDAKPIQIRAAKELPYVVAAPAQAATAVYSTKDVM